MDPLHLVGPGISVATSLYIVAGWRPRKRRKRSVRTELGEDKWVEHLPVAELKGKHVRGYRRAAALQIGEDVVDDDGDVDVRALVTGMDLGDVAESKSDAVIAICVTAWSLPYPVPEIELSSGQVTGAEVLDELDADDLIAIEQLLAPHGKKLAARPDPKKGTTSGSSGSSRERRSGSRRG